MKNITIFLLLFVPAVISARNVQQTDRVTANLTLAEAVDYHITASENPLGIQSTVTLAHEDAWLFFDEIRPSEVISLSSRIYINDEVLENGVNARVAIYAHGAVVIPHASDFAPLTVYKGEDFTGESTQYDVNYHTSLGEFDNAIHSFKLRRGYMATLADEADGTGYSRVFIADEDDVEFAVIPKLAGRVSFIRVFRWNWVTKKGFAGSSSDYAENLHITHNYDWSNTGIETTDNVEAAMIRAKRTWPTLSTINAKENVTHLLGYNEPDHPEQHEDDNGGQAISVELALSSWPEMMKSGLRLGSPAPTNFSWLYQFVDSCDARNYRLDYVAIHCYWGGKSAQNWYNDLKYVHERTGRKIWITEWNNGANWTSEWWPGGRENGNGAPVLNDANLQDQLNDLKGILNVLDTAHFVERYHIYEWVQDVRHTMLDGEYTPAGQYYRDNKSDLAYRSSEDDYVPPFELVKPAIRTISVDLQNADVKVVWTNPNTASETNMLTVERRKSTETEFQPIYQIEHPTITQYIDTVAKNSPGVYYYRVKIESDMSDTPGPVYSEEVPASFCRSSTVGDLRYGMGRHFSRDQYTYLFDTPFESTLASKRVIICGTMSNDNNLAGMTAQVRSDAATGFTAEAQIWNEKSSASFNKEETVPFMALPVGSGQIGTLHYEAGKASVSGTAPLAVAFETPFVEVPVVFVRATTLYSGYPIIARVRNVTTDGFEVMVTTETGATVTTNSVSYVAIEQGMTETDGRKIKISSGEHVSNISFGDEFPSPFFYAGMQTRNDERTSMLRYQRLTSTDVSVNKNLATNPAGTTENETNGWMVIGDLRTTLASTRPDATLKAYAADKRIVVEGVAGYEIYNAMGMRIPADRTLPVGVYIVRSQEQAIKVLVR